MAFVPFGSQRIKDLAAGLPRKQRRAYVNSDTSRRWHPPPVAVMTPVILRSPAELASRPERLVYCEPRGQIAWSLMGNVIWRQL